MLNSYKKILLVVIIVAPSIHGMEKKDNYPSDSHSNQDKPRTDNNSKQQPNTPEPPGNIFVNYANITNLNNPAVITESQMRPGVSLEHNREYAEQNGELSALRKIAERKILIEDELQNATRSKKLVEHELDIELYKKDLLKTKYSQADQLKDARFSGKMKATSQFSFEEEYNTLSQAILHTRAVQEGEAKATSLVAMENQLNKYHPDRQYTGKIVAIVQAVSSKLAADTLYKAGQVTLLWGAETVVDLFLDLPFDICKRLKKEKEQLAMMQLRHAAEAKEKQDKVATQAALSGDIILLGTCWEKIQQAQAIAEKTADPQEKQQRLEVCEQLKDKHFEGTVQLIACTQLNFTNQPQMKSLIRKEMEERKQQQMLAAAHAQMQAQQQNAISKAASQGMPAPAA